MVYHPIVTTLPQIAMEATEGSIGANFKIMPNLSAEWNPDGTWNQYTPAGQQYVTTVIEGREWSTGTLPNQPLAFTELPYALASNINYAAPVANGATGWDWTFTPPASSIPVTKTFTWEWGDGSLNYRVLGCYFNEVVMRFSRDITELSGTVMGRLMNLIASKTGGAATLANNPMAPAKIDAYFASTFANLAVGGSRTKITQSFEAEFRHGNRFEQMWPMDSAQPSFAAKVVTRPQAGFKMVVAADQTGTDYTEPFTLADMRAGSMNYVRIEVNGGTIGAGPATFKFALDVAVKCIAAPQIQPISNAAVGAAWEFVMATDVGGFGAPFKAFLTTDTPDFT